MERAGESALPNQIKIQKIVLLNIFLTPTVTACRTYIKMTALKGKDDGWLLNNLVNNNYVPVIDLNSEEFNQKYSLIKFVILKKQWVPVKN